VKGKRILLWLSIAALIALIVGATASAQRSAPVKVALVTDIGGLNDKGFNHLSFVGLQRAEKKLGINGRVFITNSAADRKPNLQSAAQQGYGLVIAVGVLFEFGPLDDVAPAFPNTKFAGVDVDWSGLSKHETNVRGIQFREQEAGYLVGYIAGLWETRHPAKGKMVVGAVGANKVPAIVRYIAGYRAGVHKANKHIKVQVDYANDPTFADQAKCKETTLNQIGKGSRIEFQVAGACGLGGLNAAKQKKIWGIGVDADQGFLGPHILTSALKRVDVSVYNAIKAYKANPTGFKGGFNANYTLKNGGIGYGKLSSKLSKVDRKYLTTKVAAIEKLIIKGKIKIPTS
jgi:basic membrane protein A